MKTILPLEDCSISQLFLEGVEKYHYSIPIYQRNYAWGESEIKTLINDVFDSYRNADGKLYYIGTLVTYKRNDNEYEVIDGQQRLTTIYIILKALGYSEIRNQLTYISRETSASILSKLGEDITFEDKDDTIVKGYHIAKTELEDKLGDKQEDKGFIEYFLKSVRIIHYRVPKDVDLNHYFEVMNSRGEQLEKHEIAKSWLNQYIDEADRPTFNYIWESCSEMNRYIQQVYVCEAGEVFSENKDSFVAKEFREIPQRESQSDKVKIIDLLRQPIAKEKTDSIEQIDKFLPIIDYPNFLLIVLKLTFILKKESEFDPTSFVLDDKEILKQFRRVLEEEDKAEFIKLFAYNLLKAKYFLDNFIVHHTLTEREKPGENPWKVQYYYKNDKNGYTKALSSDSIQIELVHLLSMFEVTFSAKQRKNYLLYCLLYLFKEFSGATNTYPETINKYCNFLRGLAEKYFYDVYIYGNNNTNNQPVANAFDNAILRQNKQDTTDQDHKKYFLNTRYIKGSANIPLFVFNYTDYVIWKMYANKLRGTNKTREDEDRRSFFEKLGCSDFELKPFDEFYFSRTRKSLEHFYPQAKAVDTESDGTALTRNDINCFGNFAMIGAEANSSGSNWDPHVKLDHYLDPKSDPVSVASLKFRIMMQMCRDKNGWTNDEIISHQNKMLDILFAKETQDTK